MMQLGKQLDAFRLSLLDRLEPQVAQVLRAGEQALANSGVGSKAPRVGDIAPDFVLPDQDQAPFRLSTALRDGPIILMFFRGGWCPFCTLTLRAYQAVLPAIRRAGGQLIAIAPQPPGNCSATAERSMLRFPLLADTGNAISSLYNIAYEMPPEKRQFLKYIGENIPIINGNGDWKVPLPASFVIAPDGRVVLAHVVPAVHQRLDPQDALRAIQTMDIPHPLAATVPAE